LLRNPYVDPMSFLQIDLLREWRAGGRAGEWRSVRGPAGDGQWNCWRAAEYGVELDGRTEGRKVGKSESRKVGRSEISYPPTVRSSGWPLPSRRPSYHPTAAPSPRGSAPPSRKPVPWWMRMAWAWP